MQWVGPAALSGAVALALAVAWTDWHRREVPHWAVAGLFSAWLLAVVLAPEALGFDPWAGLLCGGVGLAVGLVCHGFGWLGGGDAKLLGVLALWLGPRDLPIAFLGIALCGLALLLAAWLASNGDFRRRGIPFACAMVPPTVALLVGRIMAPGGGMGGIGT